MQAVRLEIARLEGAQQAQADAARALESLCIKLGMGAPGGQRGRVVRRGGGRGGGAGRRGVAAGAQQRRLALRACRAAAGLASAPAAAPAPAAAAAVTPSRRLSGGAQRVSVGGGSSARTSASGEGGQRSRDTWASLPLPGTGGHTPIAAARSSASDASPYRARWAAAVPSRCAVCTRYVLWAVAVLAAGSCLAAR